MSPIDSPSSAATHTLSTSQLQALWRGLSVSRIMNIAFSVDGDGRMLDHGEAVLPLLNCDAQCLPPGRHFHDLLLDDESRRAWADAARAAREGRPNSIECRIGCEGGTDAMLKLIVTADDDADPPSRLFIFASDISQRASRLHECETLVGIMSSQQSLVEIGMDGTILKVNDLFSQLSGYSRQALVGQHHRVLLPATAKDSQSEKDFWMALAEGHSRSGEFKLARKDSSSFWLRGAYTPTQDLFGRPTKVIFQAYDVTDEKLRSAEFEGKMQAISRSQAVIEFTPDGTVLSANENFLKLLGYTADEVSGQHHRLFCDTAYVARPDYRAFWDRLAHGSFESGEFRRVAKGGRDIWIQATYNPVLDTEGRVYKVVKFAMDITQVKQRNSEFQGKVEAIDRSQASIEFDLKGNVLHANRNFLALMGYELEEVVGRHHMMFCEASHAKSEAYQAFWSRLGQGEFENGEYHRVTKSGRDVWIRASYNPVLDANGVPYKVVKFAQDVTASKLRNSEFEGLIAAVDRAQAMIEFDLEGRVLQANGNFLALMGYTLDDIKGRHHRMFCDEETAASAGYTAFWDRLGRGEFDSGEYKRLAKNGREVWIRATYNPIIGLDGRPVKVVKLANDITEVKRQSTDQAGKIEAINRSQAVIEFDIDGNVLWANDNFLHTMGYASREVLGKHHSMFCTAEHIVSTDYRDLWGRLNKGEFVHGRFHRVGKYGRKVSLMATYSPILGPKGDITKIVKHASDITD